MPIRKRSLSPWLAALLILSTAAVSPALAERSGPPNVIVILTDDQGYADAGFQGSPDITTPHIDALAREGVVCTAGYVSCPVCAPTRAGLLTGRYQNRFGFEYNAWDQRVGIPVDEFTLADGMASAGYKTIAIGKWHVGQRPEFRPLQRGFTDHYGFLGGGRSYFPPEQSRNVRDVPKNPLMVQLWRNEQKADDPPYLTDGLGDAAVEYIDRYRDEPFFIYLAFNAPHVPLQATDRYLSRFPNLSGARRTYAAMMSSVDDAMGRIEAKLDETGLQDDTLVFYFSDNGGPASNGSDNTPLRGQKGFLREGGIRVPFIVKWPGQLPAGTTYDHPVFSLDVAATALELADATLPENVQLDGVNIVPYLKRENSARPHETLYWRYIDQRAIRHLDWKLLTMVDSDPALYDLSRDISESTDVSAERPEIVKDLTRRLDDWAASFPKPFGHPGPRARLR